MSIYFSFCSSKSYSCGSTNRQILPVPLPSGCEIRSALVTIQRSVSFPRKRNAISVVKPCSRRSWKSGPNRTKEPGKEAELAMLPVSNLSPVIQRGGPPGKDAAGSLPGRSGREGGLVGTRLLSERLTRVSLGPRGAALPAVWPSPRATVVQTVLGLHREWTPASVPSRGPRGWLYDCPLRVRPRGLCGPA